MARHIIYRLEDANGGGIFRTNAPQKGVRYVSLVDDSIGRFYSPDRYRHLTPDYDEVLRNEVIQKFGIDFRTDNDGLPHLIFGFKSIKNFRDWFYRKEWRMKLTLLGIKLNKYIVEDDTAIAKGESQIVFDRRFAVLVDTRSPMYRDC